MSTIIRGSGDTTFGGTIQSTGIDDNATSTAITIGDSFTAIKGIKHTYNTTLYGTDGTISNYAADNGVYINGNSGGWLRLNADGSGTTGIDVSASEHIKFKTNGTDRLTLTSDGRGLSQFTAKSWANFNGTGTVAIRDSHNVSSLADNGVGVYTITFSNNLANGNFSAIFQARAVFNNNGDATYAQTYFPGSISVKHYEDGVPRDAVYNNLLVFGN